MKKVTSLKVCLLATALLAVAVVARAQQLGAASGEGVAAQPGQGAIDQESLRSGQSNALGNQQNQLNPPSAGGRIGIGQDQLSRPAPLDQPGTLPEPGAQERSVHGDQAHSGQPGLTGQGQRGQLGVWMVATDGPGVVIERITSGSGAEQAGLRTGDVILQVNGRWASSPESVAQLIRQIPIGDSAKLEIWRDGQQQTVTAKMQPVPEREPHQVAFRGDESASTGDLASRTMRLEQQLGTVMQELQKLRQEVTRLSSAHSGGSIEQATGVDSQPNQPATAPETNPLEQTTPPPGFEQPSASEPQPGSESPGEPSATPDSEPFGDDEQPKTEEEPKAEEIDSLFQ